MADIVTAILLCRCLVFGQRLKGILKQIFKGLFFSRLFCQEVWPHIIQLLQSPKLFYNSSVWQNSPTLFGFPHPVPQSASVFMLKCSLWVSLCFLTFCQRCNLAFFSTFENSYYIYFVLFYSCIQRDRWFSTVQLLCHDQKQKKVLSLLISHWYVEKAGPRDYYEANATGIKLLQLMGEEYCVSIKSGWLWKEGTWIR